MGKKNSKVKKLTDDEILELRKTTEFTEDELQKWYTAFKAKCPNNRMSQSKFCEMYSKSFKTGDATIFAGHIFRTFDKNNDGTIDFQEFIQGLSIISRGSKETKLRWAFEMYDSDGSGEVSRKEMLEIVRSIFRLAGGETTSKLPRDESTPEKFTNKLFEKLDGDRSGTINQQEFLRGAQCYPSFMKLLENPASVR